MPVNSDINMFHFIVVNNKRDL